MDSRWIVNFISRPRLFGSCAAVHSDQDGRGLDLSGSTGTDNGSGQLEYGLRQCQESTRYEMPEGWLLSNFGLHCLWLFYLYNCVSCLYSVLFSTSISLSAYKWMHGELKGNVPLQYLAWVTYPMILVMFASLFCHLVSPQAIGMLSITCQPRLCSPVPEFSSFFMLLSAFLL